MDRAAFNQIYDAMKATHFEYKRKGKQSALSMHSASSSSYYSISGAVSSESYLPCIEYNMADWLNTAEVQEALHVKTPSSGWDMCSDAVWNAWPDSDYDLFMQEYYTNIIQQYSEELDLKLAVYSGDDDSVCGLTGTQYWLARWDGFEADSAVNWSPWEDADGELGGYYTIYHDEDNLDFNALHFITVRTAGHMVPTTQPQRALTLLQKYLYELSNTR